MFLLHKIVLFVMPYFPQQVQKSSFSRLIALESLCRLLRRRLLLRLRERVSPLPFTG